MQKVLLDLILFNPKKIKLYNFNIKLTKETQIGYGIHNTLKKQMKNTITFNHNQIVMFDFINFFYKKRIIFLDNNLKSIIKNGKNNYLKIRKKMEKIIKKFIFLLTAEERKKALLLLIMVIIMALLDTIEWPQLCLL